MLRALCHFGCYLAVRASWASEGRNVPRVDFLADPAWSILLNEYGRLKDFDLARFTFEMDEFTEEVRKLVAAVFRN